MLMLIHGFIKLTYLFSFSYLLPYLISTDLIRVLSPSVPFDGCNIRSVVTYVPERDKLQIPLYKVYQENTASYIQ